MMTYFLWLKTLTVCENALLFKSLFFPPPEFFLLVIIVFSGHPVSPLR